MQEISEICRELFNAYFIKLFNYSVKRFFIVILLLLAKFIVIINIIIIWLFKLLLLLLVLHNHLRFIIYKIIIIIVIIIFIMIIIIIYTDLKMASERSKRRDYLSLIFIASWQEKVEKLCHGPHGYSRCAYGKNRAYILLVMISYDLRHFYLSVCSWALV